jgi:hypothetical protein
MIYRFSGSCSYIVSLKLYAATESLPAATESVPAAVPAQVCPGNKRLTPEQVLL